MSSHRAQFGLLLIGLLAPIAFAQSSVTTPPDEIPGDRSFYLNQPVDHPEAVSGVWETSDGHGGAVGIHIQLATTVSGDAIPPIWTPQQWQHLNFGVFQRKGPEIVFGEENYFSDSVRGGSVRIENGRIQLHAVSTLRGDQSFDVDLLQQPDHCWHGRFHRGSFDSMVTLCRPAPDSSASASTKSPASLPSLLTGTWTSTQHGCIHIFESGHGTFTGWTDDLQVPGEILFSPSIPPPHDLLQDYGDLAKVRLTSNGEVSLEFGAYNPMCCSHLFKGRLSADGSTIRGDYPPGLTQSPYGTVWTKVRGDACVDPARLRRTKLKVCPPGKN